jgi:hypothetical protein
MSEVAIIINGVRYDKVVAEKYNSCKGCELKNKCSLHSLYKKCCDAGDWIFKKSNEIIEK